MFFSEPSNSSRADSLLPGLVRLIKRPGTAEGESVGKLTMVYGRYIYESYGDDQHVVFLDL